MEDILFLYLKPKVSQILFVWLNTLNKRSIYILYKLDNKTHAFIGATPASGPLRVTDEAVCGAAGAIYLYKESL